MDLSILQEDQDNSCRMTLLQTDILQLRNKSKTSLPVTFPIDNYMDNDFVKKKSEEPALINFQKDALAMFNSTNGQYFISLLANGDFRRYNVSSKTLKPIKGLPYFSINSSRGIKSVEDLNCFISEDGNLMMVKYVDRQGLEDFWVWTLLSNLHVSNKSSLENNTKSGIWIRCVFESLNDRPNQVIGLPGDSEVLEHTLNSSSMQRALNPFKENKTFERPNTMSYGHDIDVKFIKEDLYEGTVIKIVQTKLFKVENYYKTAIDADKPRVQSQLDHIKVLEIDSMNFKLNFIKRGGNTILSDYSSTNFKRHACKLEFLAAKNTQNQLITRFDHKAKLCIIALNSMHMFYCQCYFYSPDTNVGYQVKLFNLVKPNDHPTFDSHGKTSLWIDDIQWSPSDLT